MTNSIIRFFLENKLVAVLLLLVLTGWGIATAPFNWNLDSIPRDPVPVDAIPDLGENQQIVYTEWPGQSPQDVEDQITYPLTTQLLTVPGVRTVRSTSMTGLSSIYVIFEEDVEFYWSRSRILEKLNALPAGTLPGNVQPALGPDATALGQVYWYTLEGRDQDGNPTGGWDPQELRSIQDFYVGYGLSGAQGVAEVSAIGGFVREYQVDVDPNKMKVYDVTLSDIFEAVRKSNVETGARTLELNNAEYLVRGLGYIDNIEDLEAAVVKVVDNTPIRIQDVAFVTMGPAQRRGALDKVGAEAVGGVVVARQGANPQQVIDNVKSKITEISSGLPSKTLSDGKVSQVTIVPFYDRSELIGETLGTLEEALSLEILITIIVIVIMVLNLRASILISSMLPLAVLMCFIG
ncbi:MAG: efflux RND transporter permease subunit, partial [Balneolaceae bacterium]|nr:efflux RND transporter permease subunit [Balneolaceae bacterium]